MEEIEFSGPKKKEQASSYVPYTPAFVKATLAITGGWNPPLLLGSEGPKETVFEINGVKTRVFLKFTSEDGSSIKETPLAMCNYVAPQGDSIYDYDICREATITNSIREMHNTFIIKAINEFMTINDCGSSCGQICLPAAPPDSVKKRLEEIGKLTKDKLGTTRKAIAYLAERDLYCGRDYDFDDAFEKANDVCFTEICLKRSDIAVSKIASGEGRGLRVTLDGRPPSWWDGCSPRDSAGIRVEWQRGKGHTFLTPELVIKESFAPEPTMELVAVADSPSSPSERLLQEEEDDFDSIFKYKPSTTLQLTAPHPEDPSEDTCHPEDTCTLPDSKTAIIEDEPVVYNETPAKQYTQTINGGLPPDFFD